MDKFKTIILNEGNGSCQVHIDLERKYAFFQDLGHEMFDNKIKEIIEKYDIKYVSFNISHWHIDHYGGFGMIYKLASERKIEIDKVIITDSDRYEQIETLDKLMSLSMDNYFNGRDNSWNGKFKDVTDYIVAKINWESFTEEEKNTRPLPKNIERIHNVLNKLNDNIEMGDKERIISLLNKYTDLGFKSPENYYRMIEDIIPKLTDPDREYAISSYYKTIYTSGNEKNHRNSLFLIKRLDEKGMLKDFPLNVFVMENQSSEILYNCRKVELIPGMTACFLLINNELITKYLKNYSKNDDENYKSIQSVVLTGEEYIVSTYSAGDIEKPIEKLQYSIWNDLIDKIVKENDVEKEYLYFTYKNREKIKNKENLNLDDLKKQYKEEEKIFLKHINTLNDEERNFVYFIMCQKQSVIYALAHHLSKKSNSLEMCPFMVGARIFIGSYKEKIGEDKNVRLDILTETFKAVSLKTEKLGDIEITYLENNILNIKSENINKELSQIEDECEIKIEKCKEKLNVMLKELCDEKEIKQYKIKGNSFNLEEILELKEDLEQMSRSVIASKEWDEFEESCIKMFYSKKIRKEGFCLINNNELNPEMFSVLKDGGFDKNYINEIVEEKIEESRINFISR